MSGRSAKKISISNELHVVMDAIGGLHSLTRQWIDSFGQEPQIPDQVYALLTLLMDRLRLLDRAARGTIDPFLVWVQIFFGDVKRPDLDGFGELTSAT
jgi:hypothetical protein